MVRTTLKAFCFVAPLLAHAWSAASDDRMRVVPAPARVSLGAGALPIDPGFDARFVAYRNPLLSRARDRFLARLAKQTGIHRFGVGDGPTLELVCREAQGTSESYVLDVDSEGARLEASSPLGVLRGLQTALQLVRLGRNGFELPALHVEDEPRFPWRGLLLDVSRHFLPVPVVARNLDAMEAVKLNVLHWHLTDDQGFRIESRKFPKLHGLGSGGEFYSQEEIRDLVAYAADRGIRVVPELDIPGHATSWLAGYPELASLPGPYEVEDEMGIRDPVLDPSREEVYRFLDELFEEMAELFPDPYVHIGGDEVTGAHWDESPRIQRFKRERNLADNRALQSYFNGKVAEILARHGKRMVGWDEILDPGLPSGTVVQSWRGREALRKTVSGGFGGILSFGSYLDHMFPAWFHYGIDPFVGDGHGEVLGGEACMWGELVTAENIDGRLWPRAAAVAERLWSPRDVGDVHDLYRRLDALSRDLDRLGLQHVSGPRRMLERLAGGHDAGPLVTLASVLEPVRFYARLRIRTYTTATPLNRLVDAVRPESETARRFAALVRDPLGHSGEIRRWLEKWRANDEKLQPLTRSSILLEETVSLSRDLFRLAETGLAAMRYLESREAPTSQWVSEQRSFLDAVAGPDLVAMRAMEEEGRWPEPGTWWSEEKSRLKPHELEIAIVPAVSELVEAAANLR